MRRCVFTLLGVGNHWATLAVWTERLDAYFPQQTIMNRKHTVTPERLAAQRYTPEQLKTLWGKLHLTDREPWPGRSEITRAMSGQPDFAAWVREQGGPQALAAALQAAWAEFHAGDFTRAIELGAALGALGACVANRAAAVESLYTRSGPRVVADMLLAAVERGERATEALPEHANTHYTLALVLGRYSQRISIAKAITDGLAGRVKEHLERTLELEPRHAEAHVALGLYNAEIVHKLGGVVASLTYGVSARAAIEHFRRAVQLAPRSPIVHMEYAYGLLLLDADGHREEAEKLYREAAECEPLDAMEALDVARAKRGVPG